MTVTLDWDDIKNTRSILAKQLDLTFHERHFLERIMYQQERKLAKLKESQCPQSNLK